MIGELVTTSTSNIFSPNIHNFDSTKEKKFICLLPRAGERVRGADCDIEIEKEPKYKVQTCRRREERNTGNIYEYYCEFYV